MEFIGADNYVRLAQDPEFWNSLLVTAVYAVGVCLLSVVSGLLVALLLDAPIRGRGFYRGVYFLPAVTSSVAAAIVWRYLLDPAGYVNSVLAQFGIAGPDWLQDRWLALGALTLLTVWKNLGFNAVLYLTALANFGPYNDGSDDVLQQVSSTQILMTLLAGLAILLCAMIIDRIVQGRSEGGAQKRR